MRKHLVAVIILALASVASAERPKPSHERPKADAPSAWFVFVSVRTLDSGLGEQTAQDLGLMAASGMFFGR